MKIINFPQKLAVYSAAVLLITVVTIMAYSIADCVNL